MLDKKVVIHAPPSHNVTIEESWKIRIKLTKTLASPTKDMVDPLTPSRGCHRINNWELTSTPTRQLGTLLCEMATTYPLVNVYTTIQNHFIFWSIDQLFLWPFSIATSGNQTWRAGKYSIQFGDFPIEPQFRVDFQPATFDFRRVILVIFVWVKTEDLGCFYVLVPLFDPYPRSSKRRKQTDVPSGSQTWQQKIENPFWKGVLMENHQKIVYFPARHVWLLEATWLVKNDVQE